MEERRIKCRCSKQEAGDYRTLLKAKAPLFAGNTNQEPVQKKRKFDKGQHKITELGSKKYSKNESNIHQQQSDILLNTHSS